MSRRRGLRRVMGAAMLTAGALVGVARGADQITAKLSAAPLAAPEAVLSAPDGTERLIENTVLPSRMNNVISMASGTAAKEITIGGTTISVSLPDEKGFVLKCGEKTFKLEKGEGVTFKPVDLTLKDGRGYRLAFPYGAIYGVTSGAQRANTPTQGYVVYQSGSVQTFNLHSLPFCIYDSNADGRYTLADDAMAIGSPDGPVNVFVPLRRLVATETGVYRIGLFAADGSEIGVTKTDEKTGKLALAVAGNDHVMRVAFTSADAGMSLVLGDKTKELAVLPGAYTIGGGLVYSKSEKKAVAMVVPGKLGAKAVVADKTQAIEMGGPFALTFEVDRQPGGIAISSAKMHLFGKSGEEYTNFKWKAEPEITLASGGKVLPVGKMAFG